MYGWMMRIVSPGGGVFFLRNLLDPFVPNAAFSYASDRATPLRLPLQASKGEKAKDEDEEEAEEVGAAFWG